MCSCCNSQSFVHVDTALGLAPSPHRIWTSVDFPAPLWPSSTVIWPACASKLMPCSAWVAPYALTSCLMLTTAADCSGVPASRSPLPSAAAPFMPAAQDQASCRATCFLASEDCWYQKVELRAVWCKHMSRIAPLCIGMYGWVWTGPNTAGNSVCSHPWSCCPCACLEHGQDAECHLLSSVSA
jgi:hypothetical protein